MGIIIDWLFGDKLRLAAITAASLLILALALALWLLWGENKALGLELGQVTAAGQAQARSIEALLAERRALDGLLTAREAELDEIRKENARAKARLATLMAADPDAGAWGRQPLPGAVLRLFTDQNSHHD